MVLKSTLLMTIIFSFSIQSHAQLDSGIEVCKNTKYEWDYLKTITIAKCDQVINGNFKNKAKESVTNLDVTLELKQMVQCKDKKPVYYSEQYYNTVEDSRKRTFVSEKQDFYSLSMFSTSGYWTLPSEHHYFEPGSSATKKLWIEDNQKIQIVNKFSGDDWKNTATYNKSLKQLRVIHTRKNFFSEKIYADVILQCH